ncbi:MAG: hypothetical protein QXY49_02665 [Thermofilaceae archaeon]
MAKVVPIRAGKLQFISVNSRKATLFFVPVPSGTGKALLIFGAKVRSKNKIWWTPTLALSGQPLQRFVSRAGELADKGKGRVSFSSKKNGLFIKVTVKGSRACFALGQRNRVFISLGLSARNLGKLSRTLASIKPRRQVELPRPLTWRSKEAVFGPYV